MAGPSPPAPCLTGWVASIPRKKEMSKIKDAVPWAVGICGELPRWMIIIVRVL